MRRISFGFAAWICALAFAALASAQAPGLPSWNDGAAKTRIVEFVRAVSDQKSKDFVAPADRIAVFDNDGTLWSEQPLYVQFVFMLDQLKAAAPKHPEWQNDPAFKALATHDKAALAKLGQKPVLELLGKANSGMTVGEYDKTIRDWLKSARHPKYQQPYTELTYQPMRELLAYLRANGFSTFIVSGGSRGIHASLGRAGLRHSARTGDRQPAGSEVRDEGRQAGADARREFRLRR